MEMDQQVLIKIDGHHLDLADQFYQQLQNKQAVDVTVAVVGGYIKAHRVILSMSSPYFKELLTQNPDSYPVVMLREIQKSELSLLLQYIYRGEVKLSELELNNFLRIGAMLQIKGLTTPLEEPLLPLPGEAEIQHVEASTSKMQLAEPKKIDYSSDWMPARRTPAPKMTVMKILDPGPSTSGEGSSKSVKKEKDIPYRPSCCKTSRRPAQVECPTCRRTFANNYNLKIHTRDRHAAARPALSCVQCHKSMRNASCLRVHMYQHRKRALLNEYDESHDIGMTSAIGI